MIFNTKGLEIRRIMNVGLSTGKVTGVTEM